MTFQPESAADVAAASAAFLTNVLPDLLTLPPAERFARLAAHFETSILAYCNVVGDRTFPPEPSFN